MAEILRSVSPADPTDELGRYRVAGPAEIEAAVQRARAAFPHWRDTPPEERAAVLRRFASIVERHRERIARLIAREVGKALWDARAEAALLAPKVEVTLGLGLELVSERWVGSGQRATFHPRGVLAVLGPFNFPAHLPNGHIVPALATGNTVVLKPSEHAPAVASWLAEAWREAGLPAGALEVVFGGAETGRRLAEHPGLDGVLFTGSWRAGRALAEALLDQPHKILALEMGGKNAMIVLEDAELELALAEAAVSACATTGQRCTSLSRIFVAEPIFESFTDRLMRMLAGVKTGPPLEPGVFMGPLVSCEAHERVQGYRRLATEAGGERLLPAGREPSAPFVAPGLVRFSRCRQLHPYQREEIFGPEVALYPVRDLEEAIAAVNDSDYGLAASVMTRDRARYEACIGRIRTGVLNWNRGTIGASGKLPFGGLRRSGNDRPAGAWSTLYCVAPQAHLEHAGSLERENLPPGMPRP